MTNSYSAAPLIMLGLFLFGGVISFVKQGLSKGIVTAMAVCSGARPRLRRHALEVNMKASVAILDYGSGNIRSASAQRWPGVPAWRSR